MGKELVALNQRRTSVVIATRDGEVVNASPAELSRSRAGWVMVPGLNYRRKITTAVTEQFDILEESLGDKRIKVHACVLSLMERMEKWIVEDVHEAAKRWALAEKKGGKDIITRDMAEAEAKAIVSEHFNLLIKQAASPEYAFVDIENPDSAVVIHELDMLELSLKRYLGKLIQGWA